MFVLLLCSKYGLLWARGVRDAGCTEVHIFYFVAGAY